MSKIVDPSNPLRLGEQRPTRHVPVTPRQILYMGSLAAIIGGYYIYWLAWQIRWYYAGIALACGASILFTIFGTRDTRGLVRSLVPLFIWEAYIIASTFWSPNTDQSQFYLWGELFFCMSFVIGYIWMRNLSMWQLSSFLPIMALIQLPVMAYSLYRIGALYDEDIAAVRTTFAATILFSLPFFAWRLRNRPTNLGRAGILVCMLILVGLGSRSAPVLGILAFFGTLVFVQSKKGKRLRVVVQGAVSLAVVGGLALAVPQIRNGAADAADKLQTQTFWNPKDYTDPDRFLSDTLSQAEDFDRRVQMYVEFKSFKEHPLIGNGFASTNVLTDELLGHEVSAHGLISLLAGETGAFGAIIFIGMLWLFFRRVRRAIRASTSDEQKGFWQTVRWTMVIMLLMGIFHQVVQMPSFYVVLAWGFAAAFPARRLVPGGAIPVTSEPPPLPVAAPIPRYRALSVR